MNANSNNEIAFDKSNSSPHGSAKSSRNAKRRVKSRACKSAVLLRYIRARIPRTEIFHFNNFGRSKVADTRKPSGCSSNKRARYVRQGMLRYVLKLDMRIRLGGKTLKLSDVDQDDTITFY